MIPSAKTEKRDSAEPLKRFSSERMPPLWPWKKPRILSELTPGAGRKEPNR